MKDREKILSGDNDVVIDAIERLGRLLSSTWNFLLLFGFVLTLAIWMDNWQIKELKARVKALEQERASERTP